MNHDTLVTQQDTYDNGSDITLTVAQSDFVITGTDRTTRGGDVCNKIGTYLKALAAHDNGVPFYVGLPGPPIDWDMADGVKGIEIEERYCEIAAKRMAQSVMAL